MLDVYAVYEPKDGETQSRWVRVGVAFENHDSLVTVLLDALPLTGRLQIRQREDKPPAEDGK